MNKMILTAVLVVSTLFMSCDGDDDNSTQDTIIGKWQLEQEFTNGVSDNIPDCQKESTAEFKADGTYSVIDKIDSNDDGTCDQDDSYGISWENLGNDIYGVIDSQGASIENLTITFPNGKLTISFNGNDSVVYKRIN